MPETIQPAHVVVVRSVSSRFVQNTSVLKELQVKKPAEE